MRPAYRYGARLHRVIDADTFELAIDVGFRLTHIVPVRLHGVDAPEMNTAAGRSAKAFAEQRLTDVDLIVETFRRPSGVDVQSFARYVAKVWLADSGDLFARVLIEAEQARPFEPARASRPT